LAGVTAIALFDQPLAGWLHEVLALASQHFVRHMLSFPCIGEN
jgi:hypothetical protein